MNKNVAFLSHDGRPFISLRCISECISMSEDALYGLLFEEEIDRSDYIRTGEVFFISESAACTLLTDIGNRTPDTEKVERFHIWMHSSFDRLTADKSKDDTGISVPENDEQENKNDGELLCELYHEILDILKCHKLRMDKIEERLEEKS